MHSQRVARRGETTLGRARGETRRTYGEAMCATNGSQLFLAFPQARLLQ